MSEWTTEEPEAGRLYWLSIAPEKRQCIGLEPYPAVIKCRVEIFHTPRPTKHVSYDRTTYWHPIDDDRFKGAQWKLVEPDPADPFVQEVRDNA